MAIFLDSHISGSSTASGSFGHIEIQSEDNVGEKSAIFYNRFYIRASDTNPSISSAFGGTSGNTFLGFEAGNQHVTNQPQTGFSNTAIGHYAGANLTSGDHNTLVGHVAGGGSITGDGNSAVGSYAGYNLTSGNYSTL